MNRLIAAAMTFLFLGSTALAGAEQKLKIKSPKQVGSSKGKGKKNLKSAGKPLTPKNGQKGGKNNIELDSFSFGASNPSNTGKESGSGAGKENLSGLNVSNKPSHPVKITKANDSASPSLFQNAATGESLGGKLNGQGSLGNKGKGKLPGINTTHKPIKINKSNGSASPSLFKSAIPGNSKTFQNNGQGSLINGGNGNSKGK
jgi:type VI protein secretion system component Hcp